MVEHKDPADRAEIVQWLQEKVDTGKAPDSYAMEMAVASLRNDDRIKALTYLNYYRAIILVDGATCSDPTSVGSLLEGSIFLFGKLTADERITVDERRNSVDHALRLGGETSLLRKRDPSLCRAGLTAYAKQLNVPMSPDPAASLAGLYADDPVWREKRVQILPNLKKMLLIASGVQDAQ